MSSRPLHKIILREFLCHHFGGGGCILRFQITWDGDCEASVHNKVLSSFVSFGFPLASCVSKVEVNNMHQGLKQFASFCRF